MTVHPLLISQGASRVNMSFVLDDVDLLRCVKGLHKMFFRV